MMVKKLVCLLSLIFTLSSSVYAYEGDNFSADLNDEVKEILKETPGIFPGSVSLVNFKIDVQVEKLTEDTIKVSCAMPTDKQDEYRINSCVDIIAKKVCESKQWDCHGTMSYAIKVKGESCSFLWVWFCTPILNSSKTYKFNELDSFQ